MNFIDLYISISSLISIHLEALICFTPLKTTLPTMTVTIPISSPCCPIQSPGLQQSDRSEQRLPVWPLLPAAALSQQQRHRSHQPRRMEVLPEATRAVSTPYTPPPAPALLK